MGISAFERKALLTAPPSSKLPYLDWLTPAYRETKCMSVDVAAVKFGMSRCTLYRMIYAGDIPAWRDEKGRIKLLEEPTRLALKNLRN